MSVLERIYSFRSDQKGTSTTEFVVTLPLLLLAMVFVFEFSSLFWAHHIATNNVRSAVRYLSRAPLAEPYLTNARNIAKTGNPADATGGYDWMVGITAPTIDYDPPYDTFSATDFRTAGSIIRIEVRVPYALQTFSLLGALSGGAVPTSLTLSLSEQARYIGE